MKDQENSSNSFTSNCIKKIKHDENYFILQVQADITNCVISNRICNSKYSRRNRAKNKSETMSKNKPNVINIDIAFMTHDPETTS